MSAQNNQEEILSYELYREIAEDLCMPVDGTLAIDVRFELYSSKLVYLRHLREQCFRAVNHHDMAEPTLFSAEDLVLIQTATNLTHDYLRATVLDGLRAALASFPKLERK